MSMTNEFEKPQNKVQETNQKEETLASKNVSRSTINWSEDTFDWKASRETPGENNGNLFRQMLQALSPSSDNFVELQSNASWGLVWILLIISSLLTSLTSVLPSASKASLYPGSFILNLILTMLIGCAGFFIGVGIMFGAGRGFSTEKTGRFVEQCYTFLLFSLPLSFISALLSLIPFVGPLVTFGLGIYEIILATLAIKAVHDISGGKAFLALLSPLLLFVPLVICVAMFYASTLR
ncbi:Yip1 family protein [Ktedonospora formicarum]|uniref:Yip1 domain-containing protein n=1 Tax=Ktedonospora formicarum TaxID=2778364 RepID=A0A8J3I7N0_9CHLR|nr:Yip1 family protein [Ktedonospora formicarum]GHO47557.1 hypothetical protein KSX_57200 [Ktedonospora formicarum]